MDGLSHIGLKSADLARTERFYVEVLGAEVINRREVPDRRVWLNVRGARLEIAELPAWGNLDEEQRRSLPMLAFAVGPDEVDGVVARLQSAGVPHDGPRLKATGTGVGVYFGDPDGNPLALSCAEGYVRDGMQRTTSRVWTPAPYDWASAPR